MTPAGRPHQISIALIGVMAVKSALALWSCAARHEGFCDSRDDHRGLPGALKRRPPPSTPRLESYERVIGEAFDSNRAMDTARFVDGFFRVRGNVGYQKCLERVRRSLIDGGFDSEVASVTTLELGPERATWTPVKARLEVLGLGAGAGLLHAFDDESGADRATLLVGSVGRPSTVYDLVLDDEDSDDSVRGKVVLGRGHPRVLFERAVIEGGAAGILTVDLEGYHNAEEHPDVAQFGYLPSSRDHDAFGFSISPRADETLRAAIASVGGWRYPIRVMIEVKHGSSPATTIEAVIEGTDPEAPPVVMVAHVDEPGANDNASGVAALLELALALRQAASAGELSRPRHSLVFLWGQEIECSREWIAMRRSRALAALIFDMVGADQQVVGAPLLVERMPDPGAVWMRPPDEPSGWGSSSVGAGQLRGHFLTDYVTAAVRVGMPPHPGWTFRDHPFEGGSDHVPFLQVGVPALLVWHFPDSAYHTTLDRIDRISGEEMEQVATALGAVAVGLSGGLDADHDEALSVVEHAAMDRLRHVVEASHVAQERGSTPAMERLIIEAWLRWYDEALASIGEGAQGPELTARVEAARERVRAVGEEILETFVPLVPTRGYCDGIPLSG